MKLNLTISKHNINLNTAFSIAIVTAFSLYDVLTLQGLHLILPLILLLLLLLVLVYSAILHFWAQW